MESKKRSALDRVRDFFLGHVENPMEEVRKAEPCYDRNGNELSPEECAAKRKKEAEAE